MAIGDRIDEAIVKLIANDYENALVQISIAIDATAKKKYNGEKKVGIRVRKFVDENEDLLTHCTMNGQLKFVATGEGEVRYGDKGRIGQVVYKSIRCALLHEADISDNVVFLQGPTLGIHEGKFIVSDNMLWGLVLILVGDQTNKNQKLKGTHSVRCFGVTLEINKLFGKLEKIKELTKYMPPPNIAI